MRFTKALAVLGATIALNACAATAITRSGDETVARTPTAAYTACETLLYRTAAPDKDAALSCAHRLDLWP